MVCYTLSVVCYLNEFIVGVLPKADTPILQNAPSSMPCPISCYFIEHRLQGKGGT